MSDQQSDDKSSTVGYNDYDTDDDNIYAAVEREDHVSRTELEEANWCKCVNIESEIECYCCRESSIIFDSVKRRTNV